MSVEVRAGDRSYSVSGAADLAVVLDELAAVVTIPTLIELRASETVLHIGLADASASVALFVDADGLACFARGDGRPTSGELRFDQGGILREFYPQAAITPAEARAAALDFVAHDGVRPSRLDWVPEGSSMPPAVPTGTESVRPFLPAKDFERSKAFYEALGFTNELDADDVAIYRMGTSSFLLQRYYQEDWAANFMMQLLVDDLDGWWRHIVSLDLPKAFGVPDPKPPAVQPWGLRISYVVDPSGVLWHVAQRRPDVAHDR